MEQIPYAITRQFSPAQVETITGVPVATLRDWKRRELIHPDAIKGWNKFGLGTVCFIAVLKAASDAGLSVKALMGWAPAWAGAVQMHVLAMHAAWESPNDLAELKLSERQQGGLLRPMRFGVALSKGGYHLTDDPNQFAYREGSVSYTVLDLEKLAQLIVQRADGPILKLGHDQVRERPDGSVSIYMGPRSAGDE
jgi:hypothetical protein